MKRIESYEGTTPVSIALHSTRGGALPTPLHDGRLTRQRLLAVIFRVLSPKATLIGLTHEPRILCFWHLYNQSPPLDMDSMSDLGDSAEGQIGR